MTVISGQSRGIRILGPVGRPRDRKPRRIHDPRTCSYCINKKAKHTKHEVIALVTERNPQAMVANRAN